VRRARPSRGDIGDAFAADVEAGRRTGEVGDAVDEHFGLLAAVLQVADAGWVRELVHERVQLAVGRPGADDDLLAGASIAAA